MAHHAHHHPGDNDGHAHGEFDEARMVEMLDLDAVVAGTLLDDLTAWAEPHAPAQVRDVVDLGAGTGTGTLALARRFPDATVTAVDSSPAMLTRIHDAAAHLDDRVTTLAANLDDGWPAGLPHADIIWSALALHHVTAPADFLGTLKDHLKPGGVVVLVEMDAHPRYLPHDLGIGEPGLEERLHASIDTGDMDPHPDWTDTLLAHGYDVVAQESITLTPSDPTTVGRLARLFLAHIQDRAGIPLSPGDVAALDVLLGDGPDSVLRRSDLDYRASRTIWAAHPA